MIEPIEPHGCQYPAWMQAPVGSAKVSESGETCEQTRIATRVLNAGYAVRTVQELLGHRDVKTVAQAQKPFDGRTP